MVKKVTSLILFITLCVSPLAYSDQILSSNKQPTFVHIFPTNGVFVFYAKVDTGTKPNCAGDDRWAIRTDAPGAKELVSMVISAKIAGRTITVHGTGECNSYGYGYEIAYLYLN